MNALQVIHIDYRSICKRLGWGEAYLSANTGDFLDSTSHTRRPMFGRRNASICPLAKLFHKLIVGFDDEGRVKRGKSATGTHLAGI